MKFDGAKIQIKENVYKKNLVKIYHILWLKFTIFHGKFYHIKFFYQQYNIEKTYNPIH